MRFRAGMACVAGSSLLGLVVACSSEGPREATVGNPLLGGGNGRPGAEPPPAPEVPSEGSNGSASGLVGLVDDVVPEPAACADQFAAATARPPLIQFVVDTSGSMSWVPGTERAPESGEQSKWQITQQALTRAIRAMPDDVAVGITYYPNTPGDDLQCYRPDVAAPIAPLSAEQRALIERVNSAEVPAGGTPTHGAYAFGVEQLQASRLEGPRFLLLMTDGIPTYTRECSGDGRSRVDGTPLIEEVARRYGEEEIRTFVIGSPGSEEARNELSEMAAVGGTGSAGCEQHGPDYCHFDMTRESDFSAALNRALSQITRATLACDYAVPTPPTGLRLDLARVSVVLESGGTALREFSRAASGDCTEGWRYGGDQSSIQLCSATCDELQTLLVNDPDINVRIKFGCSLSPR